MCFKETEETQKPVHEPIFISSYNFIRSFNTAGAAVLMHDQYAQLQLFIGPVIIYSSIHFQFLRHLIQGHGQTAAYHRCH